LYLTPGGKWFRRVAPTICITYLHKRRAQYSCHFVPQRLARLCTCKPS
jgi:hypothetical protein